MKDHAISIAELDNFFRGYHRLQHTSELYLLTEMVDFFDVFKMLEEKQANYFEIKTGRTDELCGLDYRMFFSKFKPLYNSEKLRGAEINVWSKSGLKQDEVRNTAVLSWWLDCNGSHGLGNILFKALLASLPKNDTMPPIPSIDSDYRVKAESLPLGERENRIDIELSHPDFLIFVEVKINASEGHEQLNRYQSLIEKKAATYGISYSGIIYLTRYEDAKPNYPGCICLSWQQLASSFRTVSLPEEAILSKMLLMQFCEHIENF